MAIAEISIEDLDERVRAGARLVDVREPDEYADGHVPGATSIPLDTVPDRVDAFVGDGPTYVICQAGGRSLRACEFLAEQGVEAINITGGTGAWKASGRALET